MDIAQTLWQLLINPNVAYLLLIIGLWAAITAFIMPGTGLPEAIAAVSLVLAITGLAQLPVNLIGAVMIAVAFVLFVLEFKVMSHGALTAGGVVSFALGSIFLVRPTETQPGLSLWVVGLATLATLGFFGVAMRAAIRTYRLPVFSSPQRRLIGARGVVKQSLSPMGTVQVKSELWSAVADEPLEAGEHVVVTAIEGLKLRVARAKRSE
jgi:membrane-bound serine protease (ClpP class)